MAKMDLAKVRATMVNIMRSCVCGDVVDKMNNYLFRYFVCLTFCRPLPPQSASMRVVVDPNLAPQAPPQKRHAKKSIYFLKESNETKTAKLAQEGCWGDASWSLKRLAGIFQKCSNEAQVGPTMVPPGGLFSQPRVGLGSPFGDRPGPAPNQHSQKKRCFTEENLSFLLACQLSRAPRGIPNA